MGNSFNLVLSALRKEKNLSQREAAAKLGVSQALLSHYENGVREPGLQFISQVCDFYGVSADYLLGRSALRCQTVFTEDELSEIKPCVEAFISLFHELTDMKSREDAEDLTSLISAFIYKIHRMFNPFDGGEGVKTAYSITLTEALMHLREAQLVARNSGGTNEFKLPDALVKQVEDELNMLFNE